jgi:hypothetical protein
MGSNATLLEWLSEKEGNGSCSETAAFAVTEYRRCEEDK